MASIDPSAVDIRDLLDAPQCIEHVVGWIDAQWSALSGRTPEQTAERFTAGIAYGQLPVTFVAQAADGSCVGVASLRERDSVDWLPGATPWICNVYVPTQARGLRVASQLCLALEAPARCLGYDAIHLATNRNDSLYHRIGYRELREIEYHG